MWISGNKFYELIKELLEEKGAEYIDGFFRKFSLYKYKGQEITVPYTQVNTFTVFIKLDKPRTDLEGYTEDNNEYNFHHPRNCSVDFAVEKFKKHLELIE